MATVLSPYLTVPRMNKAVQDKICESNKSRSRPPLDYYRSKSASRIQSELLAEAYCHIIEDRCRSSINLRRSQNAEFKTNFRSVATPELREIQREINDSSFFNRTDAFNDIKSLEKKANSLLEDYRYVNDKNDSYSYKSSCRWGSKRM